MAQILVIDDDADIAALVALKLELDGHAVVQASDGHDGLALAHADPPDVLIVDWTLPGLSGPEICARLRQNPLFAKTWLIMLTARPMDVTSVAAAGADEVVAKPFSPRHLSERVSDALNR